MDQCEALWDVLLFQVSLNYIRTELQKDDIEPWVKTMTVSRIVE